MTWYFDKDHEPFPRELLIAGKVERWGAQAVFGNAVLTARQIRDMDMATNLKNILDAKDAVENEAQWFNSHPAEYEFFEWAMKQYKDFNG
jgi:hypothetical protein